MLCVYEEINQAEMMQSTCCQSFYIKGENKLWFYSRLGTHALCSHWKYKIKWYLSVF